MAVMTEGLQTSVVKRRLRSRGVDPSTVDVEALLDRSLTLPENIANIERRTRRPERSERSEEFVREQNRKQARREARRRHRRRPAWNRRVDESIDARRTFRNPSEKQFSMWARNPSRFDIEGVDSKRPRDARTKAAPPVSERTMVRRFRSSRGFDRLVDDVVGNRGRNLVDRGDGLRVSPGEFAARESTIQGRDTAEFQRKKKVSGRTNAQKILDGEVSMV